MKKNYIKPCTDTITVKIQSLMDATSNNINMGGSKGYYNSDMGQASRGGNNWDDDDE